MCLECGFYTVNLWLVSTGSVDMLIFLSSQRRVAERNLQNKSRWRSNCQHKIPRATMLLRSALTQLGQEPPQQKVPMSIVAWMVGIDGSNPIFFCEWRSIATSCFDLNYRVPMGARVLTRNHASGSFMVGPKMDRYWKPPEDLPEIGG